MGTTQKNTNMMKSIASAFYNNLRQVFQAKAKEKSEKEASTDNGPEHRGYYRSMYYTSPEEFYRHGSGTFKKNQRIERKLNRRRRFA